MMDLLLKWIRSKGNSQTNPMSCTVYLCRYSFNPIACGASATLSIKRSDHGCALPFLKRELLPIIPKEKSPLRAMSKTIAMRLHWLAITSLPVPAWVAVSCPLILSSCLCFP
ncbi:hypothetical protein [Sideroxyarcus emersonii]|uniref:hypothetical protein n=1 Tax=Sideroxyarcus emersonii TaxID=2764705 RepID=UPI001F3894CB|nr:hypothetical protein [Sideroxyarcus emersonii]